jgi:hypothetical protein
MPTSRTRAMEASGRKKSIALPRMCWENSDTPLERRRSAALVSGER